MEIETFPTNPIQQIFPSYPYWQYANDKYILAFMAAYNSMAQGYLNWFKDTPLSVYTNSNIYGPLLDWTLNGIYGITRPVISSSTESMEGECNSAPFNVIPCNDLDVELNGSSTIANDDFYKRTATWILYLGDGKQPSFEWLKKRIARFLYGPNGGDVSVDLIQNVSIKPSNWSSMAAPTVSPQVGGSANTSYSYEIVARPSYGGSVPGPVGVTATGNSVLNDTYPNQINWGAPIGGLGPLTYDVYRTASSGSPANTGLIASGLTSLSFSDTGISANGVLPPTVNTSYLYSILFTDSVAAQNLLSFMNQGITPLPLGPYYSIGTVNGVAPQSAIILQDTNNGYSYQVVTINGNPGVVNVGFVIPSAPYIIKDSVTDELYELESQNGVIKCVLLASGTASTPIPIPDTLNGHTYDLTVSNGILGVDQIS